jgi:hypothetical protein
MEQKETQLRNKTFVAILIALLVVALLAVACGGGEPTVPPSGLGGTPGEDVTEAPSSVGVSGEVPFADVFKDSGHADTTAEAFVHWDGETPPEVPATCAKCHTSTGFQEFAKTGEVSDANVPAPAGTLECVTCHNDAAAALTSVTFPSGKVVETTAPGEAICMSCHQGRESKVSVDKQINETFKVTDVDEVVQPIKDDQGNDVAFGFRNIHYFAAGATLYGSQAQSGYEYEGKVYDPKFRHVEGYETCTACHNQHATAIRVESCSECHAGANTVEDLKNNREPSSLADYNGNGDTEEGIYYELTGLQETLYSSIQAYANDVSKTPIVYDPAAHPYFFVAGDDGKPKMDDKGSPVRYNAWTARLLKAAYNYQVSAKDPGAYAHNAKYIIELLYDSIEDLNGKLATPVDLAKLTRDDAGHFAGNTEPFRHWDAEGEVPAACAKCHSSGGLPEFIANNGTIVVARGGPFITGVVAQPPANGFMCTTCHDVEAGFPARYAVTNVPFPNGKTLTFSTEKDADGNLVPVDANLCLECHQGRESTVTVNLALAAFTAQDTPDPAIRFRNIHYLSAGATLFGTQAQGAYEYENQTYLGYNDKHPLNKCTDCHEVHKLTVKEDACASCHGDAATLQDIRMATNTTDWNGNGDTKEGVSKEIETYQANLYAAVQKYAAERAGTPIVYDGHAYPYFLVADADGNPAKNDQGAAIGYNAWTPRLLRAAFNLQYSYKDPGAFAHNPMYVMQFLYDSIQDLGGDVSALTRPTTPPAP